MTDEEYMNSPVLKTFDPSALGIGEKGINIPDPVPTNFICPNPWKEAERKAASFKKVSQSQK